MNKSQTRAEEKKKKAEEKELNYKLYWIVKRLVWETVLSEKQIRDKYSNEISEMIHNGVELIEIYRVIKSKIEGVLCSA